LNKLDKILI